MSAREAELSEEEDEEEEEDVEEEEDDEEEEEEELKEKARRAAELEKALAEEERRKQAAKAEKKAEGSAPAASSSTSKPEGGEEEGKPAAENPLTTSSRSSSGGAATSSGSGKGFSALSRLAALSREKNAAAAAPKGLVRQATSSAILGSLDLSDPKSWVKVLEADPSLKNLKTLHTNLTEKDGEWLGAFVSSNGLVALLELLQSLLSKGSPSLFEVVLQLETMGCIRALLNHGQVLASLLTQANNSSLERLVAFLAGTNLKLSCQILDMLAALCWINEQGRARTLKAFDTFKAEQAERLRFQRLVHSLASPDDLYKAKVLFLINTLINSCPTPAERSAMRQEFLNLGVLQLIEQHCPVDKKALRVQVTVFEDGWVQDAIIAGRERRAPEPVNP